MQEIDLDFVWDLFSSTGSIDAYLVYKELQRWDLEPGSGKADEEQLSWPFTMPKE